MPASSSVDALGSQSKRRVACPGCQINLPSALAPGHAQVCAGGEYDVHRFANDLKCWSSEQLDALSKSSSPLSIPLLEELETIVAVLQKRVQTLAEIAKKCNEQTLNGNDMVRDVADDNISEDNEFNLLLKTETTCCICSSVDINSIVHLEACDHRICRSCITRSLMSTSNSYQQRIKCAVQDCASVIPMFLCKLVLKASDFDALDRASLDVFVAQDNFIRCPSCKAIFEKQKGDVLKAEQDSVKTVDGSEMSSEALRLRAHHRYKCKCECEWCDLCDAVPYHNGLNCSEFKIFSTSKQCRFCSIQLKPSNSASSSSSSRALLDVCSSEECQSKSAQSCRKTLKCRHSCTGIFNERKCLPCLRCPDAQNQIIANDFCNICWVESLSSAPCIKLGCGHIFHRSCVALKLEKRWPGSRICFGYMTCPLCKQEIVHPSVRSNMLNGIKLRKQLTSLAMQRLKLDGLTNAVEVSESGQKYYKQPEQYALDRFAFYLCFKCQKPYFGGRRQCGNLAGMDEEKFNAAELVCGGCSGNAVNCPTHGTDFIEYKCHFCCKVAVWFCWGTTHFCDPCHRFSKGARIVKCPGPTVCPLGIDHPPNGREFSLGCAICNRCDGNDVPPAAKKPRRIIIEID
uniref:RING-type domain-containing protein n=1 Tax=Spongospora subterranea TaxID=70186 RepID=A0A0H5QGD2_9EUKA|eukprot:CRZ01113.1 hypothetical protein [Spongospora subterranea]